MELVQHETARRAQQLDCLCCTGWVRVGRVAQVRHRDQHCGGLADHRRDLLRGGPGLCKAESVQSQGQHGLAGRDPHLAGFRSSACRSCGAHRSWQGKQLASTARAMKPVRVAMNIVVYEAAQCSFANRESVHAVMSRSASACTPSRRTRTRCSRRACRRFRGPTLATRCSRSRRWASTTCSTLTLWTHRRRRRSFQR
eukprot:scaffold6691_cov358-Prasinococcus_capsulatus_cf.AAC.20